MLMTVAEIARNAGIYPELAGARVLITGLQANRGVDLTRAFGDHGCRMVLQVPEISGEVDALLSCIAQTSLEVQVYHDLIDLPEAAIRFTQRAAGHYGGFDCVINLIALDYSDLNGATTLKDLETMLVERLQAAARTTAVAANRMGLTWTAGSVLNVLSMPPARSDSESAVAGLARSAVQSMTRIEARKWADQGVRINAVVPRSSLLPSFGLDYDDYVRSEPDLAALALYLASTEGQSLSGLIFEAEELDDTLIY